MDQRGHVSELDSSAATERNLAIRCGQVDEEGAQPLATSCDCVFADGRDESRVARDRVLEALFDLDQIGPRLRENGLNTHGRTAV